MRLCGQCATPIGIREITSGERKVVTILFADVVGSTRFATAVDPEHLQAKMARFFQIAREEIQRYGGIVEKFIGDAVMAMFGVPVVHEDDAERAARSAASIPTRVGAEAVIENLPQVHIGSAPEKLSPIRRLLRRASPLSH